MSGGGAGGERGQPRASASRRVAFEVLRAVRESDAYANLLLPARIRRAGLSAADAGLATELSYGTLRMLGYYDRVISLAAGRPVAKIDAPVLDALRLGTHQLLGMRVAAHAAVNETVALVRSSGKASAVPFANGVLRTITRSSAEIWRERVIDAARNDDDALAAEFSHPVWIIRALRRSLAAEGSDPEETRSELRSLLAADNVSPRVNLVALPGLSSVEELVAIEGVAADFFSPVGALGGGGDPDVVVAVAEGRARVQDEGSQLVALALSRARPVTAGEQWLDLCAGPGGKAALLAAEAARSGAVLTANEIVPARAGLVRSALERVAPETRVWEEDGTRIGSLHPSAFDRILLDAPCTGLGALRRRPEARWRKSSDDLGQLTSVQEALFDSAVAALRPGGLLAYVTCSPHLSETRAIVDTAMRRHDGVVSQLDTRAVLDGVTLRPLDLRGDPFVAQLWPHRHGTDAMFLALFTKGKPLDGESPDRAPAEATMPGSPVA